MVHRIGKMLCFEAQTAAVLVRFAVFALNAVEEVAAVKLNSRFCCKYAQHTPRFWITDLGGKLERTIVIVQHEIMIVAFAGLVVKLVNAIANSMKLAKVQRCTLDW